MLPAHPCGIQTLDRLLQAGWPADTGHGLMSEMRLFLPALAQDGAARDFLIRELAEDRRGVMARLAFLRGAMRDVALHGDLILSDIDAFMARSETFSLFDYAQASGTTPAHLAATRPWVDYLATLTRTEAPFLLPLLPPLDGALLLEPGGNDGSFARALHAAPAGAGIARHVVMDLPAVCAIGRDGAVAGWPEFAAGDMRAPDWRGQADLAPDVVLFKSVLHDWPEDDIRAILQNALSALGKGGRIVIAERDRFDGMTGGTAMDYANLVFAPFYRGPEIYARLLRALSPGIEISLTGTVIDMRWFVMVARVAA
ncbi:MAG: hypothetical protein RIR62_1605 [Pseudomonadota bacterium]